MRRRAGAGTKATPAVLQTRCGTLAAGAGLVFASLSLAKGASAAIRPPLPAQVVRAAVAGLPAFLSASFLGTSCSLQPLPSPCWRPGVGCSRRHRSRWSLSSFLFMPDAAADLPAPALRSLEAPLVRACQAPSLRCGGSGRVPALLRLAANGIRRPTPAVASPVFGLLP